MGSAHEKNEKEQYYFVDGSSIRTFVKSDRVE